MTAASFPALQEQLAYPRRSRWRTAGRLARDNPVGVVALVVLLALVFVAIFARPHDIFGVEIPGLAPYGETQVGVGPRLAGPGDGTVLGTDRIGRDVLSRLMYGSAVALRVGLLSVALGTIAGSIVGLASGYIGGWFDLIVQRLVDMVQAIPFLLFAMVVVIALQRGWLADRLHDVGLGGGTNNAMFAIAIVLIPGTARLVRSSTLALKERPFVEAAEACGASRTSIVLRHIIPNAIDEVIVLATVALGGAIIAESALSFLGLGTQPPYASWGGMLNEGRASYDAGPHLVWVPSAAISITVLSVTMLGDTIRDVLDPKIRRGGKGFL
jgi:peptide/nickel transport system permease protein